VIPITSQQDTVGPIARSVTDAAITLSIMAGQDPNDNATSTQPPVLPDYMKALKIDALEGVRIGVPRKVFLNTSITGKDGFVNSVFEEALSTLKGLGAVIIDPADLPSAEELYDNKDETFAAKIDFKVCLNCVTCGTRS
jgi:amidase